MKRTALPYAAVGPHATSHSGRQLSADRQTEARAAKSARGGSVGLRERNEDGLEFVLRNADPRIDHAHMNRVGADIGGPRHAHDDLAFAREFQRISNEIRDDLAQPKRVSHDPVAHIGVDIHHEVDAPLPGPRRQHAERLADGVAERERDPLELELARLDLRNIEDVVDKPQQFLPCRMDDPGPFDVVVGEVSAFVFLHHF